LVLRGISTSKKGERKREGAKIVVRDRRFQGENGGKKDSCIDRKMMFHQNVRAPLVGGPAGEKNLKRVFDQ